jgi:hypothetical protein
MSQMPNAPAAVRIGDRWITQVLSAKAAAEGGIVRRSADEADRLPGTAAVCKTCVGAAFTWSRMQVNSLSSATANRCALSSEGTCLAARNLQKSCFKTFVRDGCHT